jgi:hypothetical protein
MRVCGFPWWCASVARSYFVERSTSSSFSNADNGDLRLGAGLGLPIYSPTQARPPTLPTAT